MRILFSENWHRLSTSGPGRAAGRPARSRGCRAVSAEGAPGRSLLAGESNRRMPWRLRTRAHAPSTVPALPARSAWLRATGSRARLDSRRGAGKREKTLMFSVQWLGARGLNRGKPGLPGGHGRRLAVLALLMTATVFETGCQSSLCGPCGVVGRATSFIRSPFHRNGGGAACCGTETVSDGGCISSGVPVEAGAPVIVPGATVLPGGATPSNVLPPDTPSNLEPLPKADPGPAPSGSIRRLPSSNGSKTGTSYETLRPYSPSSRSRNDNLAHTLISTPVPAARSAQDLARSTRREGNQVSGESVLDHLPPLDLPAEVSEKTATPPVAPAVERKPPAPAPTGDPLSGRSSSGPAPGRAGLSPTAPAPEPAASTAGRPASPGSSRSTSSSRAGALPRRPG